MIKDSIFAGRSSGYSTGALSVADANWRWATWNTTVTDAEWITRNTAPGNSETYVNPSNASDSHVDVGDPITVTNDLGNNASMRAPLTASVSGSTTLVVALYSGITSGKATVSGFAKVRLTAFGLNSTDSATFTYLGTCNSNGE